ncbi:MAG: RIP metalloprotease RseP [Bacteroidota bacterium]
MEILIMAGQLILGLSILVGLHELGHLVAAKVFGMRVEQYSIGFPPKLFGIKYGETEYSIGAIPLGGYVKISGMVDESLDTEMLSQEPQPWEFRSKPAWQRLIVMMGGIIVNVITGIFIFVLLIYINGESNLPAKEAKYGIVAYDLAKGIGLQTGDKIVKVNGKPYEYFSELRSSDVFLSSNSSYTVDRGGQMIHIDIPNDFIEKLTDKKNARMFLEAIEPFKVGAVTAGYPAAKAGLKEGDRIVGVNATPIHFFHEFHESLKANRNKEIAMKVDRNGQLINLKVNVIEEKDGNAVIGFKAKSLLNYTTTRYTFGQSVVKGTEQAFGVVFDTIKGFGKIFRREVSASKSLSGPIAIAQNLYSGQWIWERFWNVTGLLSMALAFMNFLPIPALDGGHVMFLMYEIVSGRSPSDKFLEVSQKIGMVLLLSLMVFAVFNDIFKNFFS